MSGRFANVHLRWAVLRYSKYFTMISSAQTRKVKIKRSLMITKTTSHRNTKFPTDGTRQAFTCVLTSQGLVIFKIFMHNTKTKRSNRDSLIASMFAQQMGDLDCLESNRFAMELDYILAHCASEISLHLTLVQHQSTLSCFLTASLPAEFCRCIWNCSTNAYGKIMRQDTDNLSRRAENQGAGHPRLPQADVLTSAHKQLSRTRLPGLSQGFHPDPYTTPPPSTTGSRWRSKGAARLATVWFI